MCFGAWTHRDWWSRTMSYCCPDVHLIEFVAIHKENGIIQQHRLILLRASAETISSTAPNQMLKSLQSKQFTVWILFDTVVNLLLIFPFFKKKKEIIGHNISLLIMHKPATECLILILWLTSHKHCATSLQGVWASHFQSHIYIFWRSCATCHTERHVIPSSFPRLEMPTCNYFCQCR